MALAPSSDSRKATSSRLSINKFSVRTAGQAGALARGGECGRAEPDRGRCDVPEDGAIYEVDPSAEPQDDRYLVRPCMTEKLPLSRVEVAAVYLIRF